jgi:hypothetical protein
MSFLNNLFNDPSLALRLAVSLTILVLLLLFAEPVLAQKDKFHPEWLAKDIEAIEVILPKLLPVEAKPLKEIKAIFPVSTFDNVEDLGFGARRISFSKSGGYSYLRLSLFSLNGALQDYSIHVDTSSESWPLTRSQIITAWKKNGGPEFEENDHGLFYFKSFDPGLDGYKKAVATELGVMRGVQVPAELKDDYEYLISPLQNSVVGNGGCGYGGVTPAGKEAIDALVKANRVDLVENVLKGFNPGGRVYAALALLSLKSKGRPLSDEAKNTINKISALEIKIGTCSGCFFMHHTAREILGSPEQRQDQLVR